MFEPRSVAFLGASNDPRKWGYRILFNIKFGGFQGRIYPVNPTKDEIMGLKVYRNVGDIPETPDLAVIVVPPPSVPPLMKECVIKGIKAGVVITAGFAEVSTEGEGLQREIVEVARSGGMRFVGPNSNGIINPAGRLYSQMPPLFPPPGSISVVSQSGNVVGTITRLAMANGYGCAKCISSGNEADLHAEDYLEYLAEDSQTKVILSYIEGFKDGVRFFETAKEVSKKKPIVMLKVGETPAGAMAAKSHTASLAGSDAVFEAMRKQAGVIRVRSLDELVDTGIALLCHPLPKGRRVGIVTAGGGWGVLAADACARLGLDVVSLPAETISELDSFMPAWWSRNNPVDLVAGAFGDAVIRCVEVLLRCPVVDGVIMLGLMPALPPEQLSKAAKEDERERLRETLLAAIAQIFDQLNELAKKYDKPTIVASEPLAFGAALANRIIRTLAERNSVCYDMPHQAAAAMANLAWYSEYLRQNGAGLKGNLVD
jgi:acyl-CoA synthetase (NDP forming)